MKTNEKLKANVAELFIRLREFNISHFAVPKAVRLKATLFSFYHEITNKRELQQIASYQSSDIEFKSFMKLYKDHIKEPFLY